MKKLGLTLAAIGFFLTAGYAQEGEVITENEVETELLEEVNEFKQLEVADLPEALTSAILTEFPEAITTEAFVKIEDEEKIYKVMLNLEGQIKKVYLDAEGNWIKKEDKKEESN
mgnify:CR=1 FL=1|tara:strand:+ start:2085 stop:2426 length:342 start_codon:yes stop_codon:yes gene_type:complete